MAEQQRMAKLATTSAISLREWNFTGEKKTKMQTIAGTRGKNHNIMDFKE